MCRRVLTYSIHTAVPPIQRRYSFFFRTILLARHCSTTNARRKLIYMIVCCLYILDQSTVLSSRVSAPASENTLVATIVSAQIKENQCSSHQLHRFGSPMLNGFMAATVPPISAPHSLLGVSFIFCFVFSVSFFRLFVCLFVCESLFNFSHSDELRLFGVVAVI